MAQQNNNIILVILAIVGILVFANYSGLFTIYNLSPITQYNNVPIEARFTLSNFTNPIIIAYFNDKQVYTAEDYISSNTTVTVAHINATDNSTYYTNETHEVKTYSAINQKYIYTYISSNGTYILGLKNVTEEGIFKFIVSEGNHTETQSIEVKNPFIDIKHNLENIVDKGDSLNMVITTYTPQGVALDADSVEMTVTDPADISKTINLEKDGNKFITTYNFIQAGNYNFKIRSRKAGFETKEFTVIVSATATDNVPLVVWIWTGAIIIFVILFLIKFYVRRK